MPLTFLLASSIINILHPNGTFGENNESSLESQSPQAHSLHFGFIIDIYSTEI